MKKLMSKKNLNGKKKKNNYKNIFNNSENLKYIKIWHSVDITNKFKEKKGSDTARSREVT